MRAHVANLRDGDGEGFHMDTADDADGYHSDRSDRSNRSEPSSKRRRRNDSLLQQLAPLPPTKGSRKGDTSGKGSGKGSTKGVVAQVSIDLVPIGSPSRDSPGTVFISVYRKVCQERDVAFQESDTARGAAGAVPLLEQEPATVKGKL